MKYCLVVSPSPFLPSYIHHESWWIVAWLTAFLLTASNPYAEITIQRLKTTRMHY
jgi:hypothetical protein